MSIVAAAIVLLLALPTVAAACASCIASAYGDRSYNVAYLGLILTPFVVGLAVGAIITRSWWLGRRHDAGEPIDSQLNDRCARAPERCDARPAAPMETT